MIIINHQSMRHIEWSVVVAEKDHISCGLPQKDRLEFLCNLLPMWLMVLLISFLQSSKYLSTHPSQNIFFCSQIEVISFNFSILLICDRIYRSFRRIWNIWPQYIFLLDVKLGSLDSWCRLLSVLRMDQYWNQLNALFSSWKEVLTICYIFLLQPQNRLFVFFFHFLSCDRMFYSFRFCLCQVAVFYLSLGVVSSSSHDVPLILLDRSSFYSLLIPIIIAFSKETK